MPSFGATIDRQILDQTGLTGHFDFNLEWTPAPLPKPEPTSSTAQLIAQPAPAPPLQPDSNFTRALEEQLGLKLVPQQAPIPTLVLDHIEKPSED